MVKGIGRQGVAGRAAIARRPVASRFGQADVGSVFMFPPGSYTFRAPKAGYWKFVLWGGGARGDGSPAGGDSGGYCEITRFVSPSRAVAIVCGASEAHSSVTIPGVPIVQANGGTGAGGAAPGAASGGDVNLTGSAGAIGGAASAGLGTGGGTAGATVLGGAGAPANLPFRGGAGGDGGTPFAAKTTPGGGGVAGGTPYPGGNGLIIALFVRE